MENFLPEAQMETQSKKTFVSIRLRFILGCAMLIMTWLVFFIIFWQKSISYNDRMVSLLESQRMFGDCFALLDVTDDKLYQYCTATSETREECRALADSALTEYLETAGRLEKAVLDPVCTDFLYMARTYETHARKLLSADNAADRDGQYDETKRVKQLTRDLYIHFWQAVDAYCTPKEEDTIRSWNRQLVLMAATLLLITILCLVYIIYFSRFLLYPIQSLTRTVQAERAVLSVETASLTEHAPPAPKGEEEMPEPARESSLYEPQTEGHLPETHMENGSLETETYTVPEILKLNTDRHDLPERMDLGKMRRDETMILAASLYELLDQSREQRQLILEKERLQERLQKEELRQMMMESQLHRARLEMFQSLVNPHFLFNTLSVISDLSVVEDATQTEEAIVLLSEFLRYSLAYLSRTVTMAQEMQQLKVYFDIQRLRFGERFRFETEIEPECAEVKIPAMILQPLAENAMQHGIGSYREGGWIRCFVRCNGEAVEAGVEDNGLGMTPEQKKMIEEKIARGLEGDLSGGIGLMLVYHRMQDFFEGNCRFILESAPDEGARIVFSFPRR